MTATAEEKLMYEVMKAIYESGIPVSFKGSMVLRACLMEAGYSEEIRHTVDIDANWISDVPPSAEQMVESLQNAITKLGAALDISIFRMYGEGRSAGFEIKDHSTGESIFTMDIDVNRPEAATKIYEIGEIRFRGVSSSQMIADKISSISTDIVFRRIKDVIDLYYISKIFEIDRKGIIQTLSTSRRNLGDFHGFLHRREDLKHSYDKFRLTGDVNKPPFDEVYLSVKRYIKSFLPQEKRRDCER